MTMSDRSDMTSY